MAMSKEDRARVAPFVSSLDDDTFAVTGLPEEVVAVLFAFYSRSSLGLRESLAKLLADQEIAIGQEASEQASTRLTFANEKARAFHEKYTLGYGHGSIAEHAVVHVGVEGVSILGAKAIEDGRLGSYTEKSTRYVRWDEHDFYSLPELEKADSQLWQRYINVCRNLMRTYLRMYGKVEAAIEARSSFPERMPPERRKAVVQARTLDILRGLLPASARTSLGLTMNARALAHTVRKLLGSRLPEVRTRGGALRDAGLTVAPTLLRHTDPDIFQEAIRTAVESYGVVRDQTGIGKYMDATEELPHIATSRVLQYPIDANKQIALALAFEGSDAPWNALALKSVLQELNNAKAIDALINRTMCARGQHDQAPRAFEAVNVTMELFLDYGALRDLQRHRMMLQTQQRLGCGFGYEVPSLLQEIALEDEYRAALDEAAEVWSLIAKIDPHMAQYAVPLAYRTRVLWHVDLRELIHVIELRSTKEGHPSYRRVAQDMYRAIAFVYPWLAPHIRVDMNDYGFAR